MSEPRPGLQPIVDSAASQDQAGAPAIASESRTGERALEEVVEYVLADLQFLCGGSDDRYADHRRLRRGRLVARSLPRQVPGCDAPSWKPMANCKTVRR